MNTRYRSQKEQFKEKSIEDAKWLLAIIVFLAFLVFTSGVAASVV